MPNTLCLQKRGTHVPADGVNGVYLGKDVVTAASKVITVRGRALNPDSQLMAEQLEARSLACMLCDLMSMLQASMESIAPKIMNWRQ